MERTNTIIPDAPVTGQAKIAVTGQPQQLPNQSLFNGVNIAALSTNAAVIQVGDKTLVNSIDGTGNSYALAANTSISFPITNMKGIWICGTVGDIISWIGC